MAITRHEQSKIYSKVVEANGFVFTAGITASDPKKDVKGQTQEVVDEIDRLLKLCGNGQQIPVARHQHLRLACHRQVHKGLVMHITTLRHLRWLRASADE